MYNFRFGDFIQTEVRIRRWMGKDFVYHNSLSGIILFSRTKYQICVHSGLFSLRMAIGYSQTLKHLRRQIDLFESMTMKDKIAVLNKHGII